MASSAEIKHAPTLEACAADINLWVSELQQWPKETSEQARKDLEPLTYADLADRSVYLNDCTQAPRELASLARRIFGYNEKRKVPKGKVVPTAKDRIEVEFFAVLRVARESLACPRTVRCRPSIQNPKRWSHVSSLVAEIDRRKPIHP
jgi:hypothetical protein